MIYQSIYANDDCSRYPDAIKRAVEYLKSQDFTKVEPGDYPIEGDKMYAKVFDLTSKPVEETHPEVHKKYVDVQFWVTGEELIGFAPDKGNSKVIEAVEESDLYFYDKVEEESFLKASQGDYMVFFPNDAHRPGVVYKEPITYRKVVVKVSVDLL